MRQTSSAFEVRPAVPLWRRPVISQLISHVIETHSLACTVHSGNKHHH